MLAGPAAESNVASSHRSRFLIGPRRSSASYLVIRTPKTKGNRPSCKDLSLVHRGRIASLAIAASTLKSPFFQALSENAAVATLPRTRMSLFVRGPFEAHSVARAELSSARSGAFSTYPISGDTAAGTTFAITPTGQ